MRDPAPLYDAEIYGHLFRSDLVGTCWWCGSVADSHEHKYKRTDLNRLHDGGGLHWGGDGDGRLVRSFRRSPEVRFQRTMCQKCNNARSQAFDRAYETYSQYLFREMPNLWENEGLDMLGIFGPNWRRSQLDLAKYYAKHFASMMVDDGVSPPQGLISFLNGTPYPEDCGMFLVKTESLHYGYEVMRRDGSEGIGLWISPAVFHASEDRSRITGYEVTTSVGYIGVHFKWIVGSGHVDSFFGHIEPILNKVVMSDKHRHELEELTRHSQSPGQTTSSGNVT